MPEKEQSYIDSKESRALLNRVTTFERACEISNNLRNQNKTVVFTSGCFDIIHSAHLHYLQHLKQKGDVLMVGVDNNDSARKLKGEDHPFFDEQERAMIVANVRCVDYVFVFEGVWQVEHLLRLRPNFVGVPPFDPNLESKLRKIALAKTEVIVTPPFLRSDSSSRRARILKYDYLVANIIVD